MPQELYSSHAPLGVIILVVVLLAACQPIPAPAVGPDVDRVGFPENYQTDLSVFYEFDRPDNRTARIIYANEQAAQVQPGGAFPYGSVLAMEVHSTQRDEAGEVLLDEHGRYLRDEVFGLFVMRKEPGFGAKYGELRNGEWEYVAYRPDGTFLTPPDRTNACAICHMEAGMGKDWVFGAHRFFAAMETSPEDIQPPDNTTIAIDYTFIPQTITVTVGTEVTWTNHDVLIHTVTASDLSYNSGALRIQSGFRHTFDTPGVYNYFCAIHNNMHGQIVVVEE